MLRASRASPPAAVLSVAPHDPGSCQGALVGLYLGMPLRQVLHLLQRKLSKGRNILRARILHRPWQLLHLPARPPQQIETASFPDSKGSPGSPSSSASSYSQTMMARRQDSHLRFHCPDSDSDSDGGIQGDLDNEKEEDADADVFPWFILEALGRAHLRPPSLTTRRQCSQIRFNFFNNGKLLLQAQAWGARRRNDSAQPGGARRCNARAQPWGARRHTVLQPPYLVMESRIHIAKILTLCTHKKPCIIYKTSRSILILSPLARVHMSPSTACFFARARLLCANTYGRRRNSINSTAWLHCYFQPLATCNCSLRTTAIVTGTARNEPAARQALSLGFSI